MIKKIIFILVLPIILILILSGCSSVLKEITFSKPFELGKLKIEDFTDGFVDNDGTYVFLARKLKENEHTFNPYDISRMSLSAQLQLNQKVGSISAEIICSGLSEEGREFISLCPPSEYKRYCSEGQNEFTNVGPWEVIGIEISIHYPTSKESGLISCFIKVSSKNPDYEITKSFKVKHKVE